MLLASLLVAGEAGGMEPNCPKYPHVNCEARSYED